MEIMVLQGDGIGPDIMDSALAILKVLNERFSVKAEPVPYDIGARTVASGKWNLDRILDEARKYRSILKAPMGDPGIRNKDGTEYGLDIILGLRFNLDLYANVRPVKLLPGVKSPLSGYRNPGSIDYTILRENSEGLYSSHFGGMLLRDEMAIDNQIITRKGTERISRFAFRMAGESDGNPIRKEKIVTCVDKANVLKSFAFFRRIFSEISSEFNDVKSNYMYADAMAQQMIMHPENLNVIVTENMFGDILSDLGAATVGGLGFAYSANLSDTVGMFEPVHGSAVDIAGKGIANPTAMIMSLSMMLQWIGYRKESLLVEKSLFEATGSGFATADMGGSLGTKDFTERIIDRLLKK